MGLVSLMFCVSALASDGSFVTSGGVSRQVLYDEGPLHTGLMQNLLGKKSVGVVGGDEFAVVVKVAGESARLVSKDFTVRKSSSLEASGMKGMEFELQGDGLPLSVRVRYGFDEGKPWMRKQLVITAGQDVVIEKVEVENLKVGDAFEPYQADEFTANGAAKWRPPLGQPIYTRESGTWWGMEFPAARNEVKDGVLICGYLTKVELKKGESYTSFAAVVGSADDPAFVKDAFLDYIDATRARPLRLQTQYNSWFDYGQGVDKSKFVSSVNKLNQELMVERRVPPLRAFVIDDGWQDTGKDWSKTGVWPIGGKFEDDFSGSRDAVTKAKSKLGLWLSPGCLFGGQRAIPSMEKAGWKSLDPWMSMAGEKYMSALENRMIELAAGGVEYFKLDGVFGHLNIRNFDVDGFKGAEPELNEAKYDEAKERYLSLGSQRLIKIFKGMGEANPDVYIVISNGAFLSPWWLQHIDAVWMINAGDAAGGAGRTEELVYRDKVYHRLASAGADNTQFPLNSIFNHEPKKTKSGEEADEFRRYLYMNLSRGTGFVELYLKTFTLSESDWDVLAEGMKWVHEVFPNFRRSRMIGGDPGKEEIYGYAGWNEETGYVSLHNPSGKAKEFRVQLDRALGVPKPLIERKASYSISSPLTGDVEGLEKHYDAGGEFVITMPAKAIRVFEFAATK